LRRRYVIIRDLYDEWAIRISQKQHSDLSSCEKDYYEDWIRHRMRRDPDMGADRKEELKKMSAEAKALLKQIKESKDAQ
jgi:DNA phosphorothioation-dependent restriction protein DptG